MSAFTNIIKDHRKTVSEKKKQAEISRVNLAKSIEELTTLTLNDISSVSQRIYTAQRQIDQQATRLESHTQKIATSSTLWSSQIKDLNTSLKQLGDVVHWIQVIESDMRFVAKALDNVVLTSQTSNQPSKPHPVNPSQPTTTTATTTTEASVPPPDTITKDDPNTSITDADPSTLP